MTTTERSPTARQPPTGRFESLHAFLAQPATWAAGILALLGLFAAAMTSSMGCGSTDGTFSIHDPSARPSAICRLTNFPGFPDTIGALALTFALYLGPATVLVIGSLVKVARERDDVLVACGWIATVWAIVAVAVSFTAHVGYAGAG